MRQQTGRAWLGVRLLSADQSGVRIAAVIPGSPAARVLRSGDIVTMVGDAAVSDVNQLINAVSQHKPGDVVPVVVLRDGQELAFKIELGTASDVPAFSFRMPLGDVNPDTFVFPIDPTIPLPLEPAIEGAPSWSNEFQKMKEEVERLREKLRQATGEQLESPADSAEDPAEPPIEDATESDE